MQTAASQAAQLALTAQAGDVVVRTDQNKTYMHNGGTAGTMADYTLLDSPPDAVTSVNGQTGTVVLGKTDVGLSNVDNTSDATKNAAVATLTNKTLTSPVINTPTGIVKGDVGLGNVDNTSDATKNVLSATKLTTARNIDGVSFDGTGDVTVIAPATHAATTKATPVDADEIPLVDSAASNVLKKLTWANLKATAKTYFDTIYAAVTHTHAAADIASGTIATARLGSGTANSSSYLRGDQTWAAVTGGQTVYDYIVAASGGTHTTLGAAITAASAGDTILVRSGTYSESAITNAKQLTIIGEDPTSTIITLASVTWTNSGSDMQVNNLGISISGTGQLAFTGVNAALIDCTIVADVTSGTNAVNFSSAKGRINGCKFSTSRSSGNNSDKTLKINALDIACVGNIFDLGQNSTSTTTGGSIFIDASSQNCTFSNNSIYLHRSGTTNSIVLRVGGTDNIASGNTIDTLVGAKEVGIYVDGSHNIISNNNIYNVAKGILLGNNYCVASNNVVWATAGLSTDYGVFANGSGFHCLVIGNFLHGSAAGKGVDIAASTNGTNVVGNNIYGWTTGINVGSSSTNTFIEANSNWNNTTPLTDAGTTSTIGVTRNATETLTNKRVTPRTLTTTSSATPTINTDNTDVYGLTAQAVDITSFTTNLTGTPTDGQKLWIYIVGTAARAITWGASFEAGAVALPTTTVTTIRLDVGFIWNAATSKWRCMAQG